MTSPAPPCRPLASGKSLPGRVNPRPSHHGRSRQENSLPARRFLYLLFRWRGWIVLPLLVSLCFPLSLQANPSGGQAVAGQALISSHGSTLTINQLTDRAILHWQDFSIPGGSTTQFIQPSAASAALNRVLGGNPSAIHGTLRANGQVYLINPNGILVGPGGVVDTGGFLASTLDISDENFLSGGDLRFQGNSDASVVNLGKISASSSDVILIARTVENHGEIHAPNGTAALAAGSEVLVKADGEERVFIEAGHSEDTSSATQAGLIAAASAEIKAAGGNEYALAIKHTGVTRATGVSKRGGRVFLSAGGTSKIRHSGTISARKSHGGGGEVRLEAEKIELATGSKIDASAEANSPVGNGGEVLIGGGYQGQDASIRNAEDVTAEEGSFLLADAANEGDGGTVILWSDGTTRFDGEISARGGVLSGDGGFVETSGSVLSLSASARVSTAAPGGAFGTWLLDPVDMTIANDGGSDLTGSLVNPTAIVSNLNGNNITLQAYNSITVSDIVDASGNANGGDLTLDTPTLHLNAAILLQGASVLGGTATTVNVGASGLVQNGIDAVAAGGLVNLLGTSYTSTGSELVIGKSLTMRGASGGTTLSGGGTHRVLLITGDSSANGVVVTLDRLTFTGGNVNGGGIENFGGGIHIDASGGRKTDVTIRDSTISGNSAFSGGGIFQGSDSGGTSTLTIGGSLLAGNSASNDAGGGIYNRGSGGGTATVTVANSTVSGNTAANYGGGIFSYGYDGTAAVTIANSTVSDNSATGQSWGGGIFNRSDNGGTSTLTIGGSLLAGNSATTGSDYYGYVAGTTLVSQGYNLHGNLGNGNSATGTFGHADDIALGSTSISDVLEWDSVNNRPVLADNGGPTQTIALVENSIAIDAGIPGSLNLDQRGYAQKGTRRDIGAFEYDSDGNPFLVTTNTDTSASGNVGELRTAIAYANANAFLAPHITFDEANLFGSAQTIALNHGQLHITGSQSITGSAAGVTIDAQRDSRVLLITGDTSAEGIVVTLDRLTFTRGRTSSPEGGGGIRISSRTGRKSDVTIRNSTISGNRVTSAHGGGIYNDGHNGSATLTIHNSTITGNRTSHSGGGIYNNGGSFGGDTGSAILTVTNSTITGNTVGSYGGGIMNASGSLTLGGTLLEGNDGADYDFFGGAEATITSLGHNLSSSNLGGTTDIHFTGDIATVLQWDTVNDRPVLADHGGPTPTIALVTGSAAYLAGGANPGGLTDQRGLARGATISIGAWDFDPANLSLAPVVTTELDLVGGDRVIGQHSGLSLREAIWYANNGLLGTAPSITFDEAGVFSAAQTIALNAAHGQLHITASQSILGSAAGVTLDALGNSRVLEITGDTSASGVVVTLDRLTFTGGNVNGGGIENFGGGIHIDASGGRKTDVTIRDSTISGNSAFSGGGIFHGSDSGGTSTLTIGGSLLADNSASNDAGGGIYNRGSGGGTATVTVANSTVSGNTAANYGGGIFSYGYGGSAAVTIVNSTVSDNSATGQSWGGGIFNRSDNGGTSTLTIGGSILAGNSATTGSDYYGYVTGTTLISQGYNLHGNLGNGNSATGTFGHATDIALGTTPLSDVLQWDTVNDRPVLADHGGPTPTIALVTGSAAYLAGGANPGGLLDQRGLARGATMSIGAWDFDPAGLSLAPVVTTELDLVGGDRVIGQHSGLSLREAIWYANNGLLGAAPSITFDEAGVFSTAQTIALNHGQLHITASQSILGSAAGVTLDAQGNSRVLEITGDSSASGVVVTLDRLTLTGGNVSGADGGGGIYIDGSVGRKTDVSLTNSTISGNFADYGGGIFNNGESGSAELTLTNSTISGNAALLGGGIFNNGESGSAKLTLTNSTLSGNFGLIGGGISNAGGSGSAELTITNSTISGNLALGGGGIFNAGGSGSADLTITNSTISGNSADDGGGILNDGGALTISGTLLAGNMVGMSGPDYLAGGTATTTSLGHNLSGYNFGGTGDIHFTGNIATVLEWDIVNNLPVLKDNGGPTHTIALVSGSPALDAGGAFSGDFDQRGEARSAANTKGLARDIGAYELSWVPPIVPDPLPPLPSFPGHRDVIPYPPFLIHHLLLLQTADMADPFSFLFAHPVGGGQFHILPNGQIEYIPRTYPNTFRTITTLGSGEVE